MNGADKGGGQVATEVVFEGDDGVEVAVHRGEFFKEGSISIAVHDKNGDGAVAYLDPIQAAQLGETLARLAGADQEDSDGDR